MLIQLPNTNTWYLLLFSFYQLLDIYSIIKHIRLCRILIFTNRSHSRNHCSYLFLCHTSSPLTLINNAYLSTHIYLNLSLIKWIMKFKFFKSLFNFSLIVLWNISRLYYFSQKTSQLVSEHIVNHEGYMYAN